MNIGFSSKNSNKIVGILYKNKEISKIFLKIVELTFKDCLGNPSMTS